jgi:hypothetical protein
MPQVKDYYPGDFWGDLWQSLAWLYARQGPPVSGWQGNALPAATSAQFVECGIVSTADLRAFAQSSAESIVIDQPVGTATESSGGPDGFPINFSPQGLPTGNVLLNTFENAVTQAVSGRCFSLQQALSGYRVDVFAKSDLFYYQGSSVLASVGGNSATWGPVTCHPGSILAALYPAVSPVPAPEAALAALPSGWIAHSNTGVGNRLSSYYVRVYVKTDIEYLQEDNIPIVVQDSCHARCGSSVVPATGSLTMHIVYRDPVAGPTVVFTTLQNLAAYRGLPRSFTVPTSDPLYVPDVTASNAAALQNRSFIYDAALAMVAYCLAGNFAAARKTIGQIDYFLDNPQYLASTVLENGEDGLQHWAASGQGDIVEKINDPAQPPYGTGNVIHFRAAKTGDSFTYLPAGTIVYPDTTDSQVFFQHKESAQATFVCDIAVRSSAGRVSHVQITSANPGPASFNSSSQVITVPVGAGGNAYRNQLVDLVSLIAELAGDTLAAINGFSVTLTSAGDLYFDNLSFGVTQPANSLSFSYDVYNGQVDQAYIRTGAMAWVCFAYAVYMASSLDYAPALYLQRMLIFLLGLQSTDPDLRGGLLYAGYGRYQDPGYQFIPGLQNYVSTEHNIDAYFAFKRAAMVLPTAAANLLKTRAITAVQAVSLTSTALSVAAAADTIASSLTGHLYIPPGSDPGHFAQGASSSGLDTSQALDAAGTWAALFCRVLGDDTKATECLKFCYSKFSVHNQQILPSSAPNSYNQAYQQLHPCSGFKPYNDSPGGYSGSPIVLWQEGTCGMITALLRMYNLPAVATYFAGQPGGLDGVLTGLIASQRVIRSTTGDGSLLNYSAAWRGMPYEFEVWPAVSATAWFWVTSVNPNLLLTSSTDTQPLPYLMTPAGQGQTVAELDGATSVGTLDIESIDPAGVLKGLAAQQNLVGKIARLRMGFPGESLGDFVTLHTVEIVGTGSTSNGTLSFRCSDVQRFTQDAQLWTNGGPSPWVPGQPSPAAPSGRAFLPNAFPISDKNPRWVQGNTIDIYLAAMQNELGLGQDPALEPSARALYLPGVDWTLINPNVYLDIPEIVGLRDGPFSGDWFEFKLTREVSGKLWLEDEILKPLGLCAIVRNDGRITLKPMKPAVPAQPVLALNDKNIIGIPECSRLPVVNVVTVRFGVDDTQRETAARQYSSEVTYQNSASIAVYKQQQKHQVEANGLRASYGSNLRVFLLADRIFRRHAFGTPAYKLKAFLSTVVLELGDFVWLTHLQLPDLMTGQMGLASVVCEVSDRQPNFAEGYVEFTLLDTRFMRQTTPYQIAPATANIPTYSFATTSQRRNYMFISAATTDSKNADGSPGSAIF